MTVWLAAGMVAVLDSEVPASLFVPVQPSTTQFDAGLAVRLIAAPATYCSLGQPDEFWGLAVGLLPLPVYCSSKV